MGEKEKLKKQFNKKSKRQLFVSCMQQFLVRTNMAKWMDDQTYLKIIYYARMGKKLNLSEPKTFNEKLQWLKLYNRNPQYTTMVDKDAVKPYITKILGGGGYVIPTYGVWEHFDEIDFSDLPDQFVLKCTHDSGSVVIVKDKAALNKAAAKKKLERSLRRNYFYAGREWPYKNVKPRILAEQYLPAIEKAGLLDYKFMCFHGKVKCSFVCSERETKKLKVTFFDRDWNRMPFERHYPKSDKEIPKPESYEKMCSFAEKLSKGIPFVRVDFYEIEGKIYFGELTFYPGCGMEEFTPESWDYKLGDWIVLPAVKTKKK